jgi:hypothetical protein
MGTAGTIIVYGLAFYTACGIASALAFVSVGVTRVQPQSVSLGARILIIPGAVALWPYVVVRWRRAMGTP